MNIFKLLAFIVILVSFVIVLEGQRDHQLTRLFNQRNAPEPITSKAGFKHYYNEEYKYGYLYAETDDLYICPDISCQIIQNKSIHIITISTENFKTLDTEKHLLETDFHCSADGPNGSRYCENTRAEEFKNSQGQTGYKVERVMYRTGQPATEDFVYVFLFPEWREGNRSYKEAGVLLYLDEPSVEKHLELSAIADTFYIKRLPEN